jgi:MFS family permease
MIIALSWLVNLFACPAAGVLVDRFGKRVLTASVLLSFAATLMFWIDHSLLGYHPAFAALALILMSVADSVVSIAPNSMIPLAAPSGDINRFVAYAASINSCQAIVGAVIGGSVMAFLGPDKALLILLLMFALASLATLSLKLRPAKHGPTVEGKVARSEWLKGFRAVKTIVPERLSCLLAAVINFVFTPLISIIVPVYIRLALHAPISYLVGAETSLGCGMLFGTFAAPRLLQRGATRLSVLVVGTVLMAVCIAGISSTTTLWVQALALALIGSGAACFNIASSSLRGHATPDLIRGRLESAVFTCCVASIPLGSWVFGLFVSDHGIHYLGWLTGGAGLAILVMQVLLLLSRQTVAALTTPDRDLTGYYLKYFPNAFK